VPTSAILFYDTFTVTTAQDELLSRRTPDIDKVGGNWVSLFNTGVQEDNEELCARYTEVSLRDTGGRLNDNDAVTRGVGADVGESDVVVTADLTFGNDSGSDPQGDPWFAGVLVRVTDSDNRWIGRLERGNNGAANAELKIYETNAGITTLRAQSLVGSSGNGYSVTITCIDNSITLSDNTNDLTYASATHNNTATIFGWVITATANEIDRDMFSIDNFKVVPA